MGHWFESNSPDISGGSSVGRAIEKNPIVVSMFVEFIITYNSLMDKYDENKLKFKTNKLSN